MPNRMRDRNECHSVLNERQIAKALFEGRLVPGCPSAVSEAPTSKDLLFRCAVNGRFRYSDLKEAAPRGSLWGLYRVE